MGNNKSNTTKDKKDSKNTEQGGIVFYPPKKGSMGEIFFRYPDKVIPCSFQIVPDTEFTVPVKPGASKRSWGGEHGFNIKMEKAKKGKELTMTWERFFGIADACEIPRGRIFQNADGTYVSNPKEGQTYDRLADTLLIEVIPSASGGNSQVLLSERAN